jgi:hypothetical protein
MSILNLFHSQRPVSVPHDVSAPDDVSDRARGSSRPLWRRPGELLTRVTVVIWAALWTTSARMLVVAARLIGWFAEEPRRIRAAVLGITASVLAGAVAGLVVGVVVSGVVGVTVAFIHDELVAGP